MIPAAYAAPARREDLAGLRTQVRPIAIDVCLRHGDLAAALRHADELERYTLAEPLPPSSFYVLRARLLVETPIAACSPGGLSADARRVVDVASHGGARERRGLAVARGRGRPEARIDDGAGNRHLTQERLDVRAVG